MNAKLITEIVFWVVGAVAGGIWAASKLVEKLRRNEKDISGVSARERADAAAAAVVAAENAKVDQRQHHQLSIALMALCKDEDRKWLADFLMKEIQK